MRYNSIAHNERTLLFISKMHRALAFKIALRAILGKSFIIKKRAYLMTLSISAIQKEIHYGF